MTLIHVLLLCAILAPGCRLHAASAQASAELGALGGGLGMGGVAGSAGSSYAVHGAHHDTFVRQLSLEPWGHPLYQTGPLNQVG